ncbi:hypothetical protein TcCL_ESM05863 [Trypanosoma cruzi]|nr:hypothetical protein TcCL_ESM05863 [Trypanosoma cruzi]
MAVEMLAETTRLLNAPSKPSSRLCNAMKRNTGGSRVTEDGQWERFSQRRKCQDVKQKRREEVRRGRHLPCLTCAFSFVQRGSNDTVVAVPARTCTSLPRQ